MFGYYEMWLYGSIATICLIWAIITYIKHVYNNRSVDEKGNVEFVLKHFNLLCVLKISKSWFWTDGEDTFILHFGVMKRGSNTAFKIVVMPLLIMFGLDK